MEIAANLAPLGALLGQVVSFFRSNQTADLLLTANIVVWGLHLLAQRELRRTPVPVRTEHPRGH